MFISNVLQRERQIVVQIILNVVGVANILLTFINRKYQATELGFKRLQIFPLIWDIPYFSTRRHFVI